MPRQKPSAHGRILGAAFARLADAMEPKCPMVPNRCGSCAFRAGTIPNQMAATLVQAMHCVIGTDPNSFYCHQTLGPDGQPTHLCAGYVLVQKAPFEQVRQELIVAAAELDRLQSNEASEIE